MDNYPLVSVYIPTYNRLNLLKRAVNSVLAQDYLNIELLIVDDGSKDGTVDYLKSLSLLDERVKFLLNEKNHGACICRNKAIDISSGELITGLDDDDYFMPNRVSSLVKAWQNRRRKAVAVCSNSYILNEGGRIKKTKRPRIIKKENLIDSNCVGNQVLTKVSVIKKAGKFDPVFLAWQDLDLWYRLLAEKDSEIECTKEATYVVDVGHPHERISQSRKGKIKDAFIVFSDKHKLTDLEKKVLAIQLYYYGNALPSLYSILLKVIRRPVPINIWHSGVLIIRKLQARCL